MQPPGPHLRADLVNGGLADRLDEAGRDPSASRAAAPAPIPDELTDETTKYGSIQHSRVGRAPTRLRQAFVAAPVWASVLADECDRETAPETDFPTVDIARAWTLGRQGTEKL